MEGAQAHLLRAERQRGVSGGDELRVVFDGTQVTDAILATLLMQRAQHGANARVRYEWRLRHEGTWNM